MAKFNDYFVRVQNQDSGIMLETEVRALSLESAWRKAVKEAFAAREIGVGDIPTVIFVERKLSASEYQG